MGLKYVNNDACYPSLMVVGQIMNAVLSGKYDLSKTAIIVDTAAINMNRKNNVPHKEPKDIFENTTVIVKNSKLGPASGLIP